MMKVNSKTDGVEAFSSIELPLDIAIRNGDIHKARQLILDGAKSKALLELLVYNEPITCINALIEELDILETLFCKLDVNIDIILKMHTRSTSDEIKNTLAITEQNLKIANDRLKDATSNSYSIKTAKVTVETILDKVGVINQCLKADEICKLIDDNCKSELLTSDNANELLTVKSELGILTSHEETGLTDLSLLVGEVHPGDINEDSDF
jgi:hypothetical protein